jgi:hypothetical protein
MAAAGRSWCALFTIGRSYVIAPQINTHVPRDAESRQLRPDAPPLAVAPGLSDGLCGNVRQVITTSSGTRKAPGSAIIKTRPDVRAMYCNARATNSE